MSEKQPFSGVEFAPIHVTTGIGLTGHCWAESGRYRLVSYSDGYREAQRFTHGSWWPVERIPEAIEQALCNALGIAYVA